MKTNKRGFTLVEILIVVVILGILAAIVIPQFSQASSEAKVSSLQSNLQTLRSQIALYKIKNNDALPGSDDATFIAAMVPTYLQSVPKNAFNDLSTVVFGSGASAAYTSGWYIDTATGIIHANDLVAHYAY